MIASTSVTANKITFAQWKENTIQKFHQHGDIPKQFLKEKLTAITLDPEIIRLDNNQPEAIFSLGEYLSQRLNKKRINQGKKYFKTHQKLLQKTQESYGIPPQIIISFWSLETNHGNYIGNKNILRSLSTLAYDGRREKLFTEQLYFALKILHQNPHIKHQSFLGSWAGAMGHPQFMPSTFINYAVDGNKDGKIDLWNNLNDVFFSMGNYLNKLTWNESQIWGKQVILPSTLDWRKIGLEWTLPVAEWVKQGVEFSDGITPSNRFQHKASIVTPMGHNGPAFMVFDNFHVIMRWNNSIKYALSVGILSDLIINRYSISDLSLRDWNQNHPNRTQIRKLQTKLNLLNYEAGKPDGIIGKQTRKAIIRYQLEHNLIPDGYPNTDLLAHLKI
jgi:membrane-bound lytic murein transglycosylase B